MQEINLTLMNLSDYVPSGADPLKIDVKDIITNYVIELDNKIIFSLFFIFVCYFLSKIIFPRVLLGLKSFQRDFKFKENNSYFNFIYEIIKSAIDITDSLPLIFSIFIMLVAYTQGILKPYQIFLSIFIIVLCCLLYLIEILPKYYRKYIQKK